MLQFSFSHRPQRNGSYDSICTRCFATVARSHNEADLEAEEKRHVCDESVLMRRAHDLEQVPVDMAKPQRKQDGSLSSES
jgi:hypothetical protein